LLYINGYTEGIMWRKLADWHRKWEDELLGVLEQPARAAVAQSGFRRRVARKIAALSPIERQQLREFSLARRGRRGYWRLAKLLLLFSLGGSVAHLLIPRLGWAAAILTANVLGITLLIAILGASLVIVLCPACPAWRWPSASARWRRWSSSPPTTSMRSTPSTPARSTTCSSRCRPSGWSGQ
jgi:hypothetical protein